ncbi:3-hydroxyacyl-CoA dehydrogenase family protein [Alkaliphilus transvaalensis]|uniref:3-hydroxyacyl-CoA dehydrogenase family protein n=1 Tax=Alkaliphilus transvaalensis TaxID=114628 RepID=UPI00047EFE0A|nr:3-hydroxyacyl-CoA dehydrogenase family protein [Alkaliphilus transvaalensis]
MKKVGVIGAGVMGIGVAHSVAEAGHGVILVDIDTNLLEKAKEEIYNNVRMQFFFNKKEESLSPEEVIDRITTTLDYELLSDVDFIIENVPEIWEIKRDVYNKLDEICPDHCIFAVNTSCISITKIAALTKRPKQVIGTHFMNPVPMKPVIEAIKGFHTSEETINSLKELLATMNKRCVVVNDYPGFVSNRISHLLMNEAAFVVQDGVATPAEVDEIFKECFGHKMGPLETADLIGLDTVMDSLNILYQEYQDVKFRCSPLLKKMVQAGLKGRKSGEGFYQY